MPVLRGAWGRLVPAPLLTPIDATDEATTGPRTGRTRLVDLGVLAFALVLGGLTLSQARDDTVHPLTREQIVIDIACGAMCCLLLWWRRQAPVAVALACVAFGVFSTSATLPGLIALSSLAVYRDARRVLPLAALWVPAAAGYAAYSGRTGTWSVVLLMTALVAAATAWGMFVRARRQLLFTLRERAERAESDQALRAEGARLAERSRIAREMHDVLAHRISLFALHAGALEVAPDLSPDEVRHSAALLRATAHDALEELRGVIGVLRNDPGEEPAPTAPQPSLGDIPRLVDEARRAGTSIDFDMTVHHAATAPGALGRDAYRVVQESLTNVRKHAGGMTASVRVMGSPGCGLHVSVRNLMPADAPSRPTLPGSGTGLLGLQERVKLAGGELVQGSDGKGEFVVEADLPW